MADQENNNINIPQEAAPKRKRKQAAPRDEAEKIETTAAPKAAAKKAAAKKPAAEKSSAEKPATASKKSATEKPATEKSAAKKPAAKKSAAAELTGPELVNTVQTASIAPGSAAKTSSAAEGTATVVAEPKTEAPKKVTKKRKPITTEAPQSAVPSVQATQLAAQAPESKPEAQAAERPAKRRRPRRKSKAPKSEFAYPAETKGGPVQRADGQTVPKRKRKRKKGAPNLVEAQAAPKMPGAQKPYSSSKPTANPATQADMQDEHISRRAAIRKKLFEVDNSNLPDGVPPVLPILETRPDSAPEKGTMQNKLYDAERGGVKKAQLLAATDLAAGILTYLRETNTPASNENMMRDLNVPVGEFMSTVDSLMQQGKLFYTKRRKIALPEQLGYIAGRLQATAKGFGFLIPDDGSADVFLPAASLAGALNGDKVIIRAVESRGSSREGEIVAITERANTRVVGTVEKTKFGFILVPDSNKLALEFTIQKGKLMGAKEQQKVVCDIVYGKEQATAVVREVLGFATDIGTDILSIIRQHDIPEEFTKAALNYARSVPDHIQSDDILRREDLRNNMIVTIDGEDAKDLDDAISLERLSNGHHMLGVHIADVSQYVKEGTPLDKDALNRATSVYFVDRVIPMLPKELSNGICSLNPAVDRLTLSCFMEIDGRGTVVNHRFAETVINSKERLTYTGVTAALEGDEETMRRYAHIMPMFEQMKELCDILRARRDRRGSIDFDIPEAKIKVDALGKPTHISMYPRGISNRIIEEFMLVCNETVAAHMAYLEKPMMYRVHETPDTEKITALNVFLGSFGLMLKGAKGDLRPKALQSVLLKAQGKPEEGIISRVMLRSLKKARYSEENLGHFGLAAENYCHFTSPIRRYPDLMVHRILKELLHGQLTDKRCEWLRANMKGIADQCSERERGAMEAERDVDDLKKCEYMAGFLGEVMDGIISGVTSFGMFVELPNTCEGLVRMSDMRDDYYTYEEKNYRFVGRHSGKIYRLGDAVTIQVAAADISTRKVDFVLVESEVPHGRKPKPKGRRL